MFEAFFEGFVLVFQWPAIGFLFLGVIIGIWLGAVPGLGGVVGLVLLLPFTFDMDPVSAIALLMGMYSVTSTSDTITSVMLGIPGTAASQATILDGYPLAKKGHAARAFGAAFTVSAFGGVFGALILAVSLPIILPIIISFGKPEVFMLGILGLAMVGSLSGESILKGLTVALLGLMFTMVGYAETEPTPRYWFGTDYMIDGLPIIPLVLGLFAIPELMELALRNISISRIPKEQAVGGGLLDGIKDAVRHKWLVIRCSLLGTYIGMLPALGPAIVDWIAYGHAVQSARDKSKFGQGDIRGVLAPEVANNSIKGGSLVPTVTFGIPGSLGSAILMGGLLIQGIRPGIDMLTKHLHITYSLVWTIVIANIVVAVLLMIWSRQVAKVAFLPGHLIVPGVMVFVFLGAWTGGASMGDWVACLSMGVIGFVMKRSGWPRPPLVLAIILGEILENAFLITVRAYSGGSWLARPIVLVIIALIIITVALAARGIIKSKRDSDTPSSGEGRERNPVLSLPLTVVLFIMFALASLQAIPWSYEVKLFPLTIALPAVLFLLFILYYDVRDLRAVALKKGGMARAIEEGASEALLSKAFKFYGYLLAAVLIALVFGQKIALPVFAGFYLYRWAGYSLRVSIGYTAGIWAVIIMFYDRIMHMFWHPFWLETGFKTILPEWFPLWLII